MDFPCTLSKALDQLNSIGCRLLSADEEPGLRFFDAFLLTTWGSSEAKFHGDLHGKFPGFHQPMWISSGKLWNSPRRTSCTAKPTGNETAPCRSTRVFHPKVAVRNPSFLNRLTK
jgi:hypothetical protein